jgi:APA family basic amino acid/polyamine antiporter
MAALATDGALPAFLARRNGSGAPGVAATALTVIHLSVLALSLAGMLSVEKMVALANGFFLANAIMALLAGARILGSRVMRMSAAVLAAVLGCVLAMSSWPLLLALAGVTWWVLGRRDELRHGPSTDEDQILDPD